MEAGKSEFNSISKGDNKSKFSAETELFESIRFLSINL